MEIKTQSTLRLLAFTGMSLIIAANFFPPSLFRAQLIISGCILMTFSPLYEKQYLLASLQFVAMSGAIMSVSVDQIWLRAGIPSSLAAIIITYFYFKGMLDEPYKYLCAVGVACLGLGYGVENALVYLVGGVVLVAYSVIGFKKGITIAIYWGILNMFFVLAVLYNIMHYSAN